MLGGEREHVTVRFASSAVAGLSTAIGGGLSITGSNGTLLITDIKLVVDELERVGVASSDDDIVPEPAGCEDFESNLFIADVPLGTGTVTVANDRIATGSYDEIEFQVKDLFVDTQDPDDVARAARIAELLAQLRQTYAEWPAGASMMIAGTFTPTGGAAQPFRVYFDAEIEVELELASPLVIDETSSGITIELRPDLFQEPRRLGAELGAVQLRDDEHACEVRGRVRGRARRRVRGRVRLNRRWQGVGVGQGDAGVTGATGRPRIALSYTRTRVDTRACRRRREPAVREPLRGPMHH